MSIETNVVGDGAVNRVGVADSDSVSIETNVVVDGAVNRVAVADSASMLIETNVVGDGAVNRVGVADSDSVSIETNVVVDGAVNRVAVADSASVPIESYVVGSHLEDDINYIAVAKGARRSPSSDVKSYPSKKPKRPLERDAQDWLNEFKKTDDYRRLFDSIINITNNAGMI